MLTEAILEQPLALWGSLLEALPKLKRFMQVEEQPVRITVEPVAWVVMDGDSRNRPVAVVLPVSNGRFIYAEIDDSSSLFWEACYVKNLSPEVNPNPSVKANYVPFSAFVKEDKASPDAKNVKEKTPLSEDMKNLVRRALRTPQPSSCPENKLA